MKIEDALIQLSKGNSVRRKSWDKNVFLYEKGLSNKLSESLFSQFNVEDLFADDWEII